MEKLLEIDKVSFFYQTKKEEICALQDLTFSVDEFEFASIVGPSGCGKTTILSLIAGLLPASSGNILLGGEKVGKDNHEKI